MQITLVGAALVVLGAILPWGEEFGVSINGLEGDAYITIMRTLQKWAAF